MALILVPVPKVKLFVVLYSNPKAETVSQAKLIWALKPADDVVINPAGPVETVVASTPVPDAATEIPGAPPPETGIFPVYDCASVGENFTKTWVDARVPPV